MLLPLGAPDTLYAAAIRELMAKENIDYAELAERIHREPFTVYRALRGASMGVAVTSSVVTEFRLVKHPEILRRLILGFLAQKFPEDWLVIAGLMQEEERTGLD